MSVGDGRVVSNFIVQAIKNEALTIYGDGTQIRSFCYVDDLVEGLIKLFFSKQYIGPINLGNPQPISVGQLAKEVISLTKSSSEIKYFDLPGDDPVLREPDISKARKELQWEPKIDRVLGLEKTYEYFKGVLQANSIK